MKALVLSLVMACVLLPTTTNAQSDGFFRGGNDNYEDRGSGSGININSNPGGITNDDFGAPLGSGLLIMVAAGAGYAAMRRRRGNVTRRSGRDVARRVPTMVLAVALLLGMTNCKKKVETINSIPASEGIHITLSLGNGSKADVNPPHVNFKGGDRLFVVSDGKYMGVVTANQDGDNIVFSGDLEPGKTPASGQPLYFYFLGNNGLLNEPVNGDVTGCTATIIDQTGYPTLPVISMAPSNETYPTSDNHYTASLHNKASLMKFNVTTPSTSAICITGMNNKVIVNFAQAANDGENNGFTYGQVDGGVIRLKGGSGTPAEKWAIVLPQSKLDEGDEGSAYSTDFSYIGTRPDIHAIDVNQYYHEGADVITMAVNTHVWNGNLAALDGSEPEGFATARNGVTIYGTLAVNVKISIAAGATVTLDNASINAAGTWTTGNYAGITCLGDATIILKDGSTNNVKGFHEDYPGIYVPSGSTLTIMGETSGTGALNASSNTNPSGSGAGIGGGWNLACGNIVIQSGVINATGSTGAAGIGSSNNGCGHITITGGTVTAQGGASGAGIGSGFDEVTGCGNITISGGIVTTTGGDYSAGIGTGKQGRCGDITIESTVTSVTAIKGGGSYSIGKGENGYCGTVTIGGTDYGTGVTPNQSDGLTYIYPVPTPPVPSGAINGLFSVSSTKQVYFSQGNLQYQASTGTWRFAEHQYNCILDNVGNTTAASNRATQADWIDLFGWGTGNNPTTASGDNGEYNTFNEWGNNTISNGGNEASSGWRTMTDAEWTYLFANNRWGFASISGTYGIVLEPNTSNTINTNHSNPDDNSYASVEAFEAVATANGLVFLPVTGQRSCGDNPGVDYPYFGYYWTSTDHSIESYSGWLYMGGYVTFNQSSAPTTTYSYAHMGQAVRLVKDAE